MNHLLEAEIQVYDSSSYKSIKFKERLLIDLVENSNKMFLGLKAKV